MTGIKYFKIGKFNIAAYGWHLLHDGIGYKQGCGYQISAKYLTLGSEHRSNRRLRILLSIKESRRTEK